MSAPPMPTSLYPSLSWNHSSSNLAMVAPQPPQEYQAAAVAGGERYDKGGKKKMNRHQGKRGTDNYGRDSTPDRDRNSIYGSRALYSANDVKPHQSQSFQTLEEISSILISEMKKKPRKEKALRDGLELQDRIHSLEKHLELEEDEGRKKKASMEAELEQLERQRQEVRRNMDEIDRKMEQARQECKRQTESLKVLPEYRDRNNIERLSRDIDQLNFHASKVKTVMTIASTTSDDFTISGVGGGGGNHIDDVGMVCPVCLAIPEDQIFNCLQCDNMLCGSCRGQVTQCPTCRKNFKNAQPRRNRLAERLIASRR